MEAHPAGPGHFVVHGAQLALAGDWQLRVEVRRGEFDATAATVSVPIRKEPLMKKTPILLVLAGALLAVPAASAHVTVNPERGAGGQLLPLRDPRPRTRRGRGRRRRSLSSCPRALSFVSFQPKPGWKRSVTMVKLAKPVTNDEGETVTERIATVTWEGGTIAPGEFDEFGISAKVPAEQGTLVFPAVQTYSNGDVVRWIGDPDADTPAPRVTLTAKVPRPRHRPPTTTAAASPTTTTDATELALGVRDRRPRGRARSTRGRLQPEAEALVSVRLLEPRSSLLSSPALLRWGTATEQRAATPRL